MITRASVLALSVGTAIGAPPAGPFWPYADNDRRAYYADTYPAIPAGNIYFGSPQLFPPQYYNPLHPDADFDGDGIINRLDDDIDGDGELNGQESPGRQLAFVAPSENPLWDKAIPFWDAEYKRAQNITTQSNPSCVPVMPSPVYPPFHILIDWDGDGLGQPSLDQWINCADFDDDNDGIGDPWDLDHPRMLPLRTYAASFEHDWDGDGIPNNEDDDRDGDGLAEYNDTLPGNPNRYDLDGGVRYNPRPTATLDDWDGDGWPNECDPEPKVRNIGTPPDLGSTTQDSDGDGWPNACDPAPCNSELPGVPLSPSGDLDNDGWPNRCDPEPCNPLVPSQPPADPADPCGDGGDPPDPPEPPGPIDPPAPHTRPDSSPPADDPDKPIPPEQPPPPPDAQIDPPGGGGGGDGACCEAICERLDILIGEAAKEVEQLWNIHTYAQSIDYMLDLFYRRTISDGDSLRNRMDNGLWTIADLLSLVRHEIQRTNQLLASDVDPGSWQPPGSGGTGPVGQAYSWQSRPGVQTPQQLVTGLERRIKTPTMGDDGVGGWSGLAYFLPLTELQQESGSSPVWDLTIPMPDLGPLDGEPLSLSIDFTFYEPLRVPVFVLIYIVGIMHCAGIVWEELRRYG